MGTVPASGDCPHFRVPASGDCPHFRPLVSHYAPDADCPRLWGLSPFSCPRLWGPSPFSLVIGACCLVIGHCCLVIAAPTVVRVAKRQDAPPHRDRPRGGHLCRSCRLGPRPCRLPPETTPPRVTRGMPLVSGRPPNPELLYIGNTLHVTIERQGPHERMSIRATTAGRGGSTARGGQASALSPARGG